MDQTRQDNFYLVEWERNTRYDLFGGNNFPTNKYYIDFAARNGLDFHSIYGYAEQPWYTDDGTWFGFPGEIRTLRNLCLA